MYVPEDEDPKPVLPVGTDSIRRAWRSNVGRTRRAPRLWELHRIYGSGRHTTMLYLQQAYVIRSALVPLGVEYVRQFGRMQNVDVPDVRSTMQVRPLVL